MSEAAPAHARKKLLVVIDDTPECERAVYYAARRAQRIGGELAAIYVQSAGDFQHWLGVETIMREEAEAEAHALMDRVLRKIPGEIGVEPERHVVFGKATDAIRDLVGSDPTIAQLVLAAAQGSEGPGPLVSAIAGGQSGGYPIPITIVPAALPDEVIDALA